MGIVIKRMPDPEEPDENGPDLPYAGTSGWSGSSTSQDRAEDADQSGVTAARQQKTVFDVAGFGKHGLTWKELAARNGWHHGQASGVLSVLHKVGRLARLSERRDRCQIYVVPEYVDGRETISHSSTRAATDRSMVKRVRELLDEYENGELPGTDALRMIREIAGTE